MTDFIKENYFVICESVCKSRPNLVEFLVTYHGIPINCPHVGL
jgi:hypothetical protein